MSGIKKPYAAVNVLTGAVVKRFKTSDKLWKYLHAPTKTSLGNLTPVSLLNVGVVIIKETDDDIEVAQIKWTKS